MVFYLWLLTKEGVLSLFRQNAGALNLGFTGVILRIYAMNVKQARKLLGKIAENISDDQLELEIKSAELLKTLFFQHIKSLSSNTSTNNHER